MSVGKLADAFPRPGTGGFRMYTVMNRTVAPAAGAAAFGDGSSDDGPGGGVEMFGIVGPIGSAASAASVGA